MSSFSYSFKFLRASFKSWKSHFSHNKVLVETSCEGMSFLKLSCKLRASLPSVELLVLILIIKLFILFLIALVA